MTNQVVNETYYLLYNYLPSLSYPLDHESKSSLLLPVFLFGCLHYIINRQNLDDVPTLHVKKEFSRMERFSKNAFNDWFHNKTFLLRHMSWNKSHNLVKWTLVELTINKIRDLFKVKLFTIRSETKKRERERERERDFKFLLTLILTGGS